jgi:hypothetical protein
MRNKPSKPKRLAFKVMLTLPDGVTIDQMKGYILDAVATMKGSYRPPGGYGAEDTGDPLFKLDGDAIKVTRLNPRRRTPSK